MLDIKTILKDTCILAALLILTEEIGLVLKLSGLALVITVANHFFDEYISLSILMSYIVRYFAITGIVMLFGFIAGWFYPSNFWMAFIYVGVVFLLAYPIDCFRVRKDIEYINKQISGRQADRMEPADDDRTGKEERN